MASCKKELKSALSSMDASYDDGTISAILVNVIEQSIINCVSNLEKSIQQDIVLTPLMNDWCVTKNEESFSKICKMFDSSLRKYATWAKPGFTFNSVELETEIFLMKGYLQEALIDFFNQQDNPSPSSFISNRLYSESTKQRRLVLLELNYEVPQDLLEIDYSDLSYSPEHLIFNESTLSDQVKECFGISGEDFVMLIENITRGIKSGKPDTSSSTLQKLLDYKCSSNFPFELRVYAIYLRDAMQMSVNDILNILMNPPFSVKGLNSLRLSDYMNKFREKARKKLAESLSKARRTR
jgi:hypothetical protein